MQSSRNERLLQGTSADPELPILYLMTACISQSAADEYVELSQDSVAGQGHAIIRHKKPLLILQAGKVVNMIEDPFPERGSSKNFQPGSTRLNSHRLLKVGILFNQGLRARAPSESVHSNAQHSSKDPKDFITSRWLAIWGSSKATLCTMRTTLPQLAFEALDWRHTKRNHRSGFPSVGCIERDCDELKFNLNDR